MTVTRSAINAATRDAQNAEFSVADHRDRSIFADIDLLEDAVRRGKRFDENGSLVRNAVRQREQIF